MDDVWHLGMNLNPSDGHIMDYITGWDDGYDIGNADTAFTKDYLNKSVWESQQYSHYSSPKGMCNIAFTIVFYTIATNLSKPLESTSAGLNFFH